MKRRFTRHDERGAALLEFAIGALVFATAIFAVIEFGRLLWTHNALTDAARRGARYAVNRDRAGSDITAAQNVVVYGSPAPPTGARPRVPGLSTGHVKVEHSAAYGVGGGSVAVRIEGFEFDFVVPLVGTKIAMPQYRTALTGESAGKVPANR